LAWALLDFDKEDRETQRATTSAAGIGRFGWGGVSSQDVPLSTVEFHLGWIGKRLLVRDIGDGVWYFSCLAGLAHSQGLKQAWEALSRTSDQSNVQAIALGWNIGLLTQKSSGRRCKGNISIILRGVCIPVAISQ
jgi:hypothetical protein